MKSVSTNSAPFLTFEEFRKCVIDYPFLLEQIKEGISGMSSSFPKSELTIDTCTDETPRESLTLEFNQSRDTKEAGFMIKIFGALVHNLRTFAKALNIPLETGSAPEPCVEYDKIGDAESIEGLISGIRFALDMLNEKASGREERNSITSRYAKCLKIASEGAMQLLKLVEETYEYRETLSEDYGNKIKDLETALEAERFKVYDLKHNNMRLLQQLRQLEKESQISERQNEQILSENQKLQTQLSTIRKQELEAKFEISNIQSLISGKEEEIYNLQTEIRRLTSFKTIQEMKGSEVKPEKYRRMRIEMMTPRSSVTVDNQFKFPPTPCGNIIHQRVSILDNRNPFGTYDKICESLKQKKEFNQKEVQMYTKLEEIERKHKQDIDFYQAECQRITNLWREEKLKNLSLRSTSVEATPMHKNSRSLFDELEQIGEMTDESISTQATPMKEYDISERDSIRFKPLPLKPAPSSTKRGRCCGFFG